ncbi:HD domain-containing protein [Caldibacillus lycopersici]|uniref:HD domain-containing protein n=1 Tax=Perspicuibacillus lycopersici TaxID=1325689 RepID=A0AAE3IS61_9BACI|nr:HD domain-containing protein [Perspicuibacillus lycopersici]MCU9613643.1 HD domain-containing protein [Perspicuibacillus lycopersici]
MKEIIIETENFVKNLFRNDSSGHDWYHMFRVRNNALKIYYLEQKGNPFIIEMAALLHDSMDDKLHDSPNKARRSLLTFLQTQSIKQKDIDFIMEIIDTISFKGGNELPLTSIEAKIVRDADRLDAIGAIGIARTFAYGGKKGNPLYDPNIAIRDNMTMDEYRNGKSSTVHHFYEKLLKLKGLMQTESARKLAEERDQFLHLFLQQFLKEWNGEICNY